MATFTVTTAQNLNAIAGKAGGDIYNINGGTLTINTDTFDGANQTTSTSLGNITISATLGGAVVIDSTDVWEASFDSGTGTIQAWGSEVTQGAVSAKLLSINTASNGCASSRSNAASPMLASGIVRFSGLTGGQFTTGAVTVTIGGMTLNLTSVPKKSTMMIVGDEASTCTVPRLGTFTVNGDWYELGTTSGSAGQWFYFSNFFLNCSIAGIYVETAVGSNVYEFWPCQNKGGVAANTTVATDVRSKVCFSYGDASGSIRIGQTVANVASGYTPIAGLRVRMPNLLFESCAAASRTANTMPHATLATRYDFTTTGGGAISISKANMAWYPSFAQAYSVAMTDTGVVDAIVVSEIAAPMTMLRVGVGIGASTSTAYNTYTAFTMSLCYAGSTFTNCVFSRYSHASAGNYTFSATDCSGLSFRDTLASCWIAKGNAGSGNFTFTRVDASSLKTTTLISGRISMTTCDTFTVSGTTYIDVPVGSTTTTAVQNSYVFEVGTACKNITFDGVITTLIANTNPYLGILSVIAAGCKNIKLRNIGTRAAPMSLQAVNGSAYLFVIAAGAAASGIYVQRCYVSNTRSGLYSADNSTQSLFVENCMGDYADAPTPITINSTFKGVGNTPSLSAQTAVYGTHFCDSFISATEGRLQLLLNEKTTSILSASSYVVLAGSPKFTSAGSLYMPVIGDSIEFTLPYYSLGHTGFVNAAGIMAGGTIGNYTIQYQLDKNDGAGFGTLKTLSGANLSAETGVSASLGFKIKIRITTAITNATAITSFYIRTVTTAASQDNQYPLDTATLTITGIVDGSDVVILSAGTNTILASVDQLVGNTYEYVYSGATNVDIGILKPGHRPLYVRQLAIDVEGFTLPVAQAIDRNYI